MSREEKQQMQQAELQKQLWSIANTLRGNMDANDFKNYILGLIFYRYLSENLVNYVDQVYLKDDNLKYEEAWKKEEYREALKSQLISDSNMGYYLEADYLWSTLINKIKTGKFDISMLAKAVNVISESTLGNESEDDFENLFEDMDLNNSKLGRGEAERTKLISTIMLKINDIDFHHEDAEIDVLGDAYEYLISKFAASAGKKAGEFYTPQQVSRILAKLVTLNKSKLQNVYDPTCGSGSLLLRVGKETKVTSYYGQELNSTTYNLARMNMLLHGISFKHFDIKNADTLEKPKHINMKFDAIVANPPYSVEWSCDPKFIEDERFSAYGKLAPKSKADFAFVQHMLFQLSDSGTMAVVLPHGVLFRSSSEGVIRKYLIKEKNYIDAIIGLPGNIFYGTAIPTCIIVFKKCRENDDNILIIDASKDYEPGKNQNRLSDENVEKIVNAYVKREEIEGYSHLATIEEIEENRYNLNISRYISSDEENEKNITEVYSRISELTKRLSFNESKRSEMFEKLGINNLINNSSNLIEGKYRFKDENGKEYPEWEETKLGKCFEHFGGTALEKLVNEDGEYNFISIGNYGRDGKYIDNGQRINLTGKAKDKLLNKGDLVMILNDKTKTGDIIGTAIYIDEDNKYIYNQRSERLVCHENVDSRYLWLLLNSRKMRKKCFDLSQGGTQIYINFPSIEEIKIKLPSLEEQKKIAEFLMIEKDRIDIITELSELELELDKCLTKIVI